MANESKGFPGPETGDCQPVDQTRRRFGWDGSRLVLAADGEFAYDFITPDVRGDVKDASRVITEDRRSEDAIRRDRRPALGDGKLRGKAQ